MRKLICLTCLMLVLPMVIHAQEETPEAENDDTTLLYVGPMTQTCVGVGEQACLVVRFEDDETLSLFYDTIEGFTFEPDFAYTLRVRITAVENPPADASSLRYELVDIEQQLPAVYENVLWELQSLNGTSVENPAQYTVLFGSEPDEGIFVGADCNRVRGDVELDPFSITTTVSTRALCAEDSLEADFVAALDSVTLLSVENGELLLQTPDGILRFAPPSIEGMTYDLTMLVQENVAFNLAEDDFEYTFTLEAEQVVMFIGCNTVIADYTREGSLYIPRMGITTEVGCPDAALETLFLPSFVYSVLTNGDIRIEGTGGVLITGTPQE